MGEASHGSFAQYTISSFTSTHLSDHSWNDLLSPTLQAQQKKDEIKPEEKIESATKSAKSNLKASKQ